MMDDVFIYHAHTLFSLSILCVGNHSTRSTSIEHKLTKRALESIPQIRSNPALIPILCFASNMPNNFSSLWFVCKHAHDIDFSCWFPTSVASTKLNNCSFLRVVCTLDAILDILPHVFLPNSPLITSLMSNNFSFPCFECNEHHMFQNEMDTIVFSKFLGVFVFPHLEDVQTNCLHIDLAYALSIISIKFIPTNKHLMFAS